MKKVLMKGNEAIGEAAICAGCIHFFGYPITPQSEIPEYLSRRLPEVGGRFVQAESEVAASNMIYGAGGVGVRVMTSSSSPGISLMSEAISYIAACEIPVVIVNIMRSGPGLGGILPTQSDYLQATKGGGHGDYKMIVLAPSSVQEAVDLVILSFDLAEKYLTPAMVIGDGMIGQMMEPVEFPSGGVGKPMNPGNWALTGAKNRPRRILNSLLIDPDVCNRLNIKLKEKYDIIERDEKRFDTFELDGKYDLLVTAFGMTSRICRTAIEELKKEGYKVGMFRPISLFPFPYQELREAAMKASRVLDVEMNMGQMLEDVKMAVGHEREIDFYGKTGGLIPSPDDIKQAMLKSLTKAGGRSRK